MGESGALKRLTILELKKTRKLVKLLNSKDKTKRTEELGILLM